MTRFMREAVFGLVFGVVLLHHDVCARATWGRLTGARGKTAAATGRCAACGQPAISDAA